MVDLELSDEETKRAGQADLTKSRTSKKNPKVETTKDGLFFYLQFK